MALDFDSDGSPERSNGKELGGTRLAFIEDADNGLIVATIAGARMQLWRCPRNAGCTRWMALRQPLLTVAAFRCNDAVCSIVQTRSDGLALHRQRIE